MESLKVKTPELEDFLIDEIEKIAKSAGDIIKAHYTQGVVQWFQVPTRPNAADKASFMIQSATSYIVQEGQLKVNREVTRVKSPTEPANAVVALNFSSEMEMRAETLDQLSCVLQ